MASAPNKNPAQDSLREDFLGQGFETLFEKPCVHGKEGILRHLTLGYLTLNAGPAETVTAAAAAGFRSVGIRITGRRKADAGPNIIGNNANIRDIRRRIEDGGMRLSNVSAYHIWDDVTHDDLSRLLETLIELDAPIVVTNKYIRNDQKFLDLLVPFAQGAEKAGIRLAIEFMKYSEAKTVAKTLELSEKSGQSNIGILVDALHLDRSGGSAADITALPSERIVFAQMCDAMFRDDNPDIEALASEARSARLEPGKGELDLYGFLDAIPQGIEIEYEVPSASSVGLPLSVSAKSAYDVFRRYMDEYETARGRKFDW